MAFILVVSVNVNVLEHKESLHVTTNPDKNIIVQHNQIFSKEAYVNTFS